MNYWKILQIVAAVLVTAVIGIVYLGASDSSPQQRQIDSGTKFNF